MKKRVAIFVSVALSCCAAFSFVSADEHGDGDPVKLKSDVILASYTWGGEAYQISLADLDTAISALPVYRQQNFKTRADKAEYLEDLIAERLQMHRATDEGFDTLEEHLKKLEEYKHQLMVEKLTELEVDEKIAFTDEDLKAHYEANLDEYVADAKARATCITLDDEDFANETLDTILAGKDIAEMAKELSEAGKLANGPGTDTQDPGNTNLFSRSASARWSEFIDAVFEQEIGELTETVFEIDVGEDTFYLIFRKEEHIPERQQTFDEVRSAVRRTVDREQKRARMAAWISEIVERGKLKTYPDNIPEPVATPEEAASETEESGTSDE